MVESVGGRRAEVRIVHGSGLTIAAARSTRIHVDDGALVLESAEAGRRVVASLGDVRRVLWLDGAATARLLRSPLTPRVLRGRGVLGALSGPDGVPVHLTSGACVVVGSDGPLLAWLVDETAPWAGDPSQKRTQSGAVALARELGLTLEVADEPLDRAAVRRVLVHVNTAGGGPLGGVVAAAVVLALVLSALAWRGFDGAVVWPYALGAALLVAPILPWSVLLRRRVLTLVRHAPDPRGRVVVRPSGVPDGDPVQLQVSRDDVVLVGGNGTERWLPGPAVLDGVATVQVVEDQLVLLDSRGEVVAMVPTWRFAPDDGTVEDLGRAAAEAGIDVDVVAPPTGRPLPPGLGVASSGPSWHSGDVNVVQAWLMWGVAPMMIVAGFAAAQDVPAVGYLVVAVGVAALLCRVWCWWTWRSWVTALRRRGVA